MTESTQDNKEGEQKNEKQIKLTVTYQSKQYVLDVDPSAQVGSVLKSFKSDNSFPENDNIRFVAKGKFLDNNKTFVDEGINSDLTIRAFKSASAGNTAHSTPNQPNTHQNTNQNQNMPGSNPNMNQNMNNPYGSFGFPNNNPMMNMGNPMGGMNNPMSGMMQQQAMDQLSNMSPSQISLQMETLMNDPQMLDMSVRMMMPNASENEIETFKKQFVENLRRVKENPAMMNMMQQQMKDMMGNGGNPMGGMPMGGNPMGGMPMTGSMGMSSPYGQNMPPMNSPYNQPNPMNQQNTMNPQVQQINLPPQFSNLPANLLTPCSHGYYHPQLLRMFADNHQMEQNMAKTTPLTDKEVEEKYSTQLDTMYSMGYTNKRKNIKALKACKGNLEMAINYILDNIGEESE